MKIIMNKLKYIKLTIYNYINKNFFIINKYID